MSPDQPRISVLVIGLVFAICIGLPLVWDIPGHWRLLRTLQNSGHSVLFLVMAFCLAWRGVHWGKAAIGLLALGGAIEVVQLFIGKDCDFQDVVLDSLGIVAGLLLFWGYTQRSLLSLTLSLAVLSLAFWMPIAIANSYLWQWRNFPVLVNFEDMGRQYLLDSYEGASYTLATGVIDGEPKSNTTLKMTCPIQNWPGIALVDLAPDWSGYDSLQLDVWLLDEQPINLGVALRGLENQSDHHDISHRFSLKPGANHLSWPMQEILKHLPDGAKLLTSINKVIIFCMPEQTRTQVSTLAIDNLMLKKESAAR